MPNRTKCILLVLVMINIIYKFLLLDQICNQGLDPLKWVMAWVLNEEGFRDRHAWNAWQSSFKKK
jgi:hypothetical protein